MSTRLVVLGLLGERPLYGYEIKQIIEQRMGDWTSIAFGSIYFALDKLAQEQLIEKIATEQEGGRPSRSIYQITDAGRREFMRLLHELWGELEHTHFAFDLAVFFLSALSTEEIKDYLHQRITQIEQRLAYLNADRENEMRDVEIPRLAHAIFDHSQYHLEADLRWTKDLLAKIEEGEYL